MGPCMCGDFYCRSCGPAQGNCLCPNCGRWSSDGGCESPEECERLADLDEQAMADSIAWEIEHADKINEAMKGGA